MCYDSVNSCVKNRCFESILGLNKRTVIYDKCSSDFASMCSRDEKKLYADHTVLVFVGTSLEELTEHVNNRLRNVSE